MIDDTDDRKRGQMEDLIPEWPEDGLRRENARLVLGLERPRHRRYVAEVRPLQRDVLVRRDASVDNGPEQPNRSHLPRHRQQRQAPHLLLRPQQRDPPIHALQRHSMGGPDPDDRLDDSNDNGRFNSIALDSNDYPRIALRNEVTDDLELVTWDGTGWSIEAVDTTNNVGSWASMAIDSNDLPRIAYIYDSYGDLRYASHDGSSWSFEDIDTSVSSSSIDLHLDDSDRPRIAYKDSNYEAWLAYNNSGTRWPMGDPAGQERVRYRVAHGYDPRRLHRNGLHGVPAGQLAIRWGVRIDGLHWDSARDRPVADTGETSNTVAMGPELVLSGDTVIAPFLNGTDGADPGVRGDGHDKERRHEITTVDGESHSVGSYGISMALDQIGKPARILLQRKRVQPDVRLVRRHRLARRGGRQHGFHRVLLVDSDRRLRQPPHLIRHMTTTPRVVMYAHHNGTSWTTEASTRPTTPLTPP